MKCPDCGVPLKLESTTTSEDRYVCSNFHKHTVTKQSIKGGKVGEIRSN